MSQKLISSFVATAFCLSSFPGVAGDLAVNRNTASAIPARFAQGSISTAAHETTPTFSPDGHTAYFMRFSEEQGGLAIFASRLVNGAWLEAEPTALPSNSGGPAVSFDGMKIFFWSIPPGTWTPHLWVAEKDGAGWSHARPLGAHLDSEGGELSPSVAANGALYFTAVRKDSAGGHDVYRSRCIDGKYAAPENLTAINSQFDEFSVAIAPDESFLVLSSRGRPDNRGESDLYLSKRQGQAWSPPMRLGPEINTAEDESNPQISADGLYLYFTRGGDVYRVETASFLPDKELHKGPWVECASMPNARVWGTAVVWTGKIYLVNGLSGWGQGAHRVNAVEEYDPVTDHWTSKADAPVGTEENVAIGYSKWIHLFAGKGHSSYRYSPSDGMWSAQSGVLPWAANQNAGIVEAGGRLFVMKSVWSEGGWVSSFVEYDSGHERWVRRHSPPLGAPGSQMAAANGRIYLIGAGEKASAVLEYDPARDVWARKASMPTGRVEVRLAVLNGRIFAIGGHVTAGAVSDAVEEYDPARDLWRPLPPLPEPRWGVGATTSNGKLYVFGGSPDAVGSTPASNKVWAYSL